MMTVLYVSPDFDSALLSMRSFLKTQGKSENILWVWRDRILFRPRKSRYFFIDNLNPVNTADIESYYSLGVERGLGITLRVLCATPTLTVCFVDLPKDELDAEYRRSADLKCCIPMPCPKAILISSHWQVWALKRVFRIADEDFVSKSVPSMPLN